MTREEAVAILQHLMNSGILDAELEAQLCDVAQHLCADDFTPCAGTAYCADCPHRGETMIPDDTTLDPELSPGHPETCAGNIDCCDECDHFLLCFPEFGSDPSEPPTQVPAD